MKKQRKHMSGRNMKLANKFSQRTSIMETPRQDSYSPRSIKLKDAQSTFDHSQVMLTFGKSGNVSPQALHLRHHAGRLIDPFGH